MVNSKQLTKKTKSASKMSLRSRSVMQNTPTTSVQNGDNNDEPVNTIRDIIKKELEDYEKKTIEGLHKISNKSLK